MAYSTPVHTVIAAAKTKRPLAAPSAVDSCGKPSASQARQKAVTIRAAMASYGSNLAAQIGHGMKEAFSESITHMLSRALWIVILGALLILFIPELPLRSHGKPAEA